MSDIFDDEEENRGRVDRANALQDTLTEFGVLKPGEFFGYGSNRAGDITTPITTNTIDNTLSQQPMKPDEIKPTFSKSGLDLNGDGIPDGAVVERHVVHQGPNGEQIKDKISWTKNPAPQVMPSMMSSAGKDNPFIDPVKQAEINMGIAKPQAGTDNPFTGGVMDAQQVVDLRMKQLEKTASGAMGGSVASRKAAGAELSSLQKQEQRRIDRENSLTIFNAKLNAPRLLEQDKAANAALEGALNRKNELDKADITGRWGAQKIEASNEGKLAIEDKRTARAKEVTDAISKRDFEKLNIIALNQKSHDERVTASEQAADILKGQNRLKERELILAHPDKLDGPSYIMISSDPRLSEEQRLQLLNRMLNGTGTPSTLPGSAPAAIPGQAQPDPAQPPATGISAPGVTSSFNSEEEAHAANLPKGTIVSIGGRRARLN